MRFCKVPVNGREVPGHDEVVQIAWSRYMGRICHVTIKLSRWRAKTMTACASAGSPIDFVSVAGTVRASQDLISGLELTLIDFLMNDKFVRAAEGN
jgi:hypothetical protein